MLGIPKFRDDGGVARRFSHRNPKFVGKDRGLGRDQIRVACKPLREPISLQVVMVIGFLGVFIVVHLLLDGLRVPNLAHAAIISSMVYVFIFMTLYTVMPLWHRAFKESKLNMAACPSCDYDLASASRDAEGRLVCSECGSAWTSPARDQASIPA